MIIIGINAAHNATASLLKDGKLIASVSEERLTRVKNQSGMPYLAIKDCLNIAGLNESDIDYLVLNHLDPKVHIGFTSFLGDKNRDVKTSLPSLSQTSLSLLWRIKEYLLTNIQSSRNYLNPILDYFYKIFVNPKAKRKLYREIEAKLNLPRKKILMVDHHLTHAYSAYYCSPLPKTKPILIFTADSSGDNICATVSIALGNKIKKIAVTPTGNSIGDLYMHTTAYMGMKPVEHEYKVMGLAAYAHPEHYLKVFNKIKDLIKVNLDLTFSSKIHSHMYYKIVPKLYAYERFDNIAAAVQKLTEETMCEWIRLAVKKTGIGDIVCGGGIFMNVKANQLISELPEVKSMYVMPSAADESTAIGAAFVTYAQQRESNPNLNEIAPVKDLYLGDSFSDEKIKQELDKKRYKRLKIEKPKNIEVKVAQLLADGKIVARFSEKMEWGARSLGNRSILADPSKLEVISEINEQIKSRDFWMPFAASIIEEDEKEYIVNQKSIKAPYMIFTFNSTEKGRKLLKAAMHTYDHTLRPQIVYRTWNPSYYKLIQEFKKLTGIGAILNTSFNLHGFPIVYTPEDALYVLENSKLKYLSLGSYLITKK